MKKYCFGIDIGGTSVKCGLFDVKGEVLDKWEVKTRTEDNGKNIIPDVADAINHKILEKQLVKEEIAGVGIGVPGPVNEEGDILCAVNLHWGYVKLVEEMEKLIGLPVKAGNDANVAALGEMWKGGGQGHKNLVAVTLGTGVGGGIIADGKILSGTTGAAGEIGHIHVMDGESERCNCGNYGCLEQYTSATGIVRLAKRRLEEDDKPSALRNNPNISAKAVFDAVKEGDELAIEVAERFGEILGKELANIAGVVNPEIFVIGGGVSKAGPILLDFIQKNYIPYVFAGSRGALFALATLGNDAGIYGAAKMVLD